MSVGRVFSEDDVMAIVAAYEREMGRTAYTRPLRRIIEAHESDFGVIGDAGSVVARGEMLRLVALALAFKSGVEPGAGGENPGVPLAVWSGLIAHGMLAAPHDDLVSDARMYIVEAGVEHLTAAIAGQPASGSERT